jgi:hypothetical protein
MSEYFDQDFLKFFLGFVAIIALSLIVILIAQNYQGKPKTQTAATIEVVSP